VARLSVVLYLASLALLPWSWFPPFPWLHEHAQWSDVVFAAAAAAWALERWRAGARPRLRSLHGAVAAYLAAAALSLLFADPRPAPGPAKLLGMAELAALMVVTSDLASRAPLAAAMARATAATTLLTALAALLGEALFLGGVPTPLVGAYGDLLPGSYARAQAGLTHPNLLASYCVFAWGVTARAGSALPAWLLVLTRAALLLAAGLTFSRSILALLLTILVVRASHPARRRAALVFALVALAVVAALHVLPLEVDPTRPLEARQGEGLSSRGQAFLSSLATLRERPLTGVGPGASPGRKDGAPFDAHFTPLNVAATLGLPALVAFLAIPVLLWRGRSRPTDLAVWGALAGMGLEALTGDVEDFRHLWMLFGLAAAGSAATAEGTRF
jgi:O-antigen ligase